MMVFIIIIHVIACLALIGLVLIQRGRGSGLVESFSGVESMFGTKTNTFLTRTTTILSILFFLTCLSLAVLSVRQSRSLMRDIKTQESAKQKTPAAEPAKQVTQELPQIEEKTTATQAQVPQEEETQGPEAAVQQKSQEAPKTE